MADTPTHTHSDVCDHSTPEPDVFNEDGVAIDADLQALAEFGHACWEQHLDPEAVGRALRGES